jgi:hypothetical protein
MRSFASGDNFASSGNFKCVLQLTICIIDKQGKCSIINDKYKNYISLKREFKLSHYKMYDGRNGRFQIDVWWQWVVLIGSFKAQFGNTKQITVGALNKGQIPTEVHGSMPSTQFSKETAEHQNVGL